MWNDASKKPPHFPPFLCGTFVTDVPERRGRGRAHDCCAGWVGMDRAPASGVLRSLRCEPAHGRQGGIRAVLTAVCKAGGRRSAVLPLAQAVDEDLGAWMTTSSRPEQLRGVD